MSLFDDAAFFEKLDAAQKRWALPAVCVSYSNSFDAGCAQTRWFGIPSSGVPSEDSVISVASNNKFFTAVGLAILIEEGKLKWTDRLADLLPDLRLQDARANQVLTLEDVLSHKSGIPAHLEAEFRRAPVLSDIVEVLNALRPTEPALKTYQYNNAFFSLAGHLMAQISGQSYASFIEGRILKPLSMFDSSFEALCILTRSSHLPSLWRVSVARTSSTPFTSAGVTTSAYLAVVLLSTPHDISIWLQYLTRLYRDELGKGEPRIIQSATLRDMMRGRSLAGHQIGGVPVNPGESLCKEFSVPAYALGQYRCHYRGRDMLYHWGAGPGAASVVLWMPEEGFSLTVWANVESAAYGAMPAIALLAMDSHFGSPDVDWSAFFWSLPTGRNDIASIPPRDFAPDAEHLEPMTGTFHSPAFGKLHITRPGSDAPGLPKEIVRKLELIVKAKSFGSVGVRKPDLIAIYENDPLFVDYLALFATGPTTFWALGHLLVDPTRVPAARSKDAVAIPASAVFKGVDESTFELVGAGTLEYRKGWKEQQMVEDKGDATFERVR